MKDKTTAIYVFLDDMMQVLDKFLVLLVLKMETLSWKMDGNLLFLQLLEN